MVAMYAIIRVDKRFWVPNNSHGPGDYSGGAKGSGSEQSSRKASFISSRRGSFAIRVLSEEQVFDEMTPEEEAESIERSRTRRSSSATATRTWTKRASVVSRAWTRRTNSGDVEIGRGGTADSKAKSTAVLGPDQVDSERSTDSE